MKKLEEKIIKRIYGLETKKTTIYIVSRFFLGLILLFSIILSSLSVFDLLNEQHSFDLFNFFQDGFEVTKKYFFSNLYNFYQELPQPLTYILLTSIIILLVLLVLIIKNSNKIKNKLISLYKFYKNK